MISPNQTMCDSKTLEPANRLFVSKDKLVILNNINRKNTQQAYNKYTLKNYSMENKVADKELFKNSKSLSRLRSNSFPIAKNNTTYQSHDIKAEMKRIPDEESSTANKLLINTNETSTRYRSNSLLNKSSRIFHNKIVLDQQSLFYDNQNKTLNILNKKPSKIFLKYQKNSDHYNAVDQNPINFMTSPIPSKVINPITTNRVTNINCNNGNRNSINESDVPTLGPCHQYCHYLNDNSENRNRGKQFNSLAEVSDKIETLTNVSSPKHDSNTTETNWKFISKTGEKKVTFSDRILQRGINKECNNSILALDNKNNENCWSLRERFGVNKNSTSNNYHCKEKTFQSESGNSNAVEYSAYNKEKIDIKIQNNLANKDNLSIINCRPFLQADKEKINKLNIKVNDKALTFTSPTTRKLSAFNYIDSSKLQTIRKSSYTYHPIECSDDSNSETFVKNNRNSSFNLSKTHYNLLCDELKNQVVRRYSTGYSYNEMRNKPTSFKEDTGKFEFLQGDASNNLILLGLTTAAQCRSRRKNSDVSRRLRSNSDITYKYNNEEMCGSFPYKLKQNPFHFPISKSVGVLQNYGKLEKKTKLLKGILKDTDRSYFYGEKSSPKIISNCEEVTFSPTLSHRSPPEGQSSGSEMLILEQELGEDGNIFHDSEVIKNFENKRLKTLLRCDSAPDKLYKDRIMKIENDKTEKERRRNSSIDCQTNRVRFKLEESFKEEEERYLQLSEVENEHLNKYEDMEVYKRATPIHINKIEAPQKINLVEPPTVISPRQRKASVFNYGQVQTIPQVAKVQKIEERKISFECLHADTYGRKFSVHEETIPIRTVQKKRKISLQFLTQNNKKTIFNDKTVNRSSESLNKDKKSKPKKSIQEENKKQRKKSKQEVSPVAQRRKSSATEKKLSISDTFRSIVVSKKKKSGCENPDLNNNKKSTWGAIKGKMKIERKTSNTASPTQSPRNFRFFRNDSSSSIGSNGRFKRGSLSRQSSERSFSDSFERKRSTSCNSMNLDDDTESIKCSVPYDKFKVWAGEKSEANANAETLPLLHVACSEGNIDLLKTLIDCGVDVHELDYNGWPALHYAICAGYFECAELLISKGSSLNLYSNKVMNTYCSEVRKTIHAR